MTDKPAPSIGEPTPNGRGFLTYGGGEIPTSYGHTIRVQESSAASGPHVWLFISGSSRVPGHDPHLSLADALRVHAALGQFIDGVPERWQHGDITLARAKREVLGIETPGVDYGTCPVCKCCTEQQCETGECPADGCACA